jgi:hypothetical protein
MGNIRRIMKKIFRRVVFISAAICFILTATNIVLFIHLAEHEKSGQHDCNHCPICQNLIINKNPILLSPPIIISGFEKIAYTIDYIFVISPPTIQFQSPYLRAPPL